VYRLPFCERRRRRGKVFTGSPGIIKQFLGEYLRVFSLVQKQAFQEKILMLERDSSSVFENFVKERIKNEEINKNYYVSHRSLIRSQYMSSDGARTRRRGSSPRSCCKRMPTL